MPLKPNLIERFLLRIGVIPTVLLDTGVSMFQASALLTAGDIGLFTHLKGGPLSLNEIKARTHTSLHGLSVLLTCMVNLGYVDQKGDQYQLSTSMRRSFPIDLFPEMVPFFRAVNEKLNQATEAVNMDPEGGIMGWDMVKETNWPVLPGRHAVAGIEHGQRGCVTHSIPSFAKNHARCRRISCSVLRGVLPPICRSARYGSRLAYRPRQREDNAGC
jgi:hypothetical protein